MNISSISSGSNSYVPISSNSEIKMLESQKEQLEKQIQATKESDMDTKTKQETIKLLQEQVQQIETQIQQKRNEKLTQATNNESTDNRDNSQTSNTKTDDSSLVGMSDLLMANASLSRVRLMSDTKQSLNGKSDVLKQEIKLDEGRFVNTEAKRAEVAEIKTKVKDLDQDIASEMHNSQDKVDDSREAVNSGESKKAVNNDESTVFGAGNETGGPVDETGRTVDGTDQSAEKKDANPVLSASDQGERTAAPDQSERSENDPLTWLLKNSDKYNKVDVLF